jgi:hypothetical protein
MLDWYFIWFMFYVCDSVTYDKNIFEIIFFCSYIYLNTWNKSNRLIDSDVMVMTNNA